MQPTVAVYPTPVRPPAPARAAAFERWRQETRELRTADRTGVDALVRAAAPYLTGTQPEVRSRGRAAHAWTVGEVAHGAFWGLEMDWGEGRGVRGGVRGGPGGRGGRAKGGRGDLGLSAPLNAQSFVGRSAGALRCRLLAVLVGGGRGRPNGRRLLGVCGPAGARHGVGARGHRGGGPRRLRRRDTVPECADGDAAGARRGGAQHWRGAGVGAARGRERGAVPRARARAHARDGLEPRLGPLARARRAHPRFSGTRRGVRTKALVRVGGSTGPHMGCLAAWGRSQRMVPRLGLLALACSDGAVVLAAVPHPAAVKGPSKPRTWCAARA